jgi:hypothetical protein
VDTDLITVAVLEVVLAGDASPDLNKVGSYHGSTLTGNGLHT